MDKKFTIATVPVVVAVNRVPTLYRIDFTGASEIPNITIPADSLEPRVATFGVAGDYVATAGLYDQDGALLGTTASVSFTVVIAPETKEVNAVASLSVSDA
jgi:hypothetical protein